MTGLVSEITRFSTRDGPGIRTTVFLKGCPLRCKWCSNPETFQCKPQLFYIPSRCKGCNRCQEICPQEAISGERGSFARVDRSRCDLCMKCTDICLTKAFVRSGRFYTAEEILSILERDRPFYGTDGGLTVSGGEPLFQGEFLKELLHNCKTRGITTALDTSGYGDPSLLQAILPDTDLALLDLKLMDPEEHKKWTGVSNELILNNAAVITAATETRISLPLIPGVNDSSRNIEATAEFAVRHGVKWVDINPFHQLGTGKYHYLGLESPYSDFPPLEGNIVQEVINTFQKHGLQTTVGRMM